MDYYLDYYRRRNQELLRFATDRTSGMVRPKNTSDTRLADDEFSCYPGYGYYSFSESDRLPCSETYHYNNFEGHDVASRLHPDLQDFRPEIDYPEPPSYPPTENMYNERGNWHPYSNRRNDYRQPRRRSHLDDIYYPNYDTDDEFADNRAGFSESKPFNRYENYSSRGSSILHKVTSRLPRRQRRTRIIKQFDKAPNERNSKANNTITSIDSRERTEVDIGNDYKQSQSVPCTTKSSDIEMSSKQSEATSSESGHQNFNVVKTKSGVDVGESNDGNTEEHISELASSLTTSDELKTTTDNSSNNCSQEVYLEDEYKSYLPPTVFVDSRVLELNMNSPIKENTESPKKRKIDSINFKQILSNLSGILQEDGQLKSNSDTNQTKVPDKTNVMSGDDLLELLQSSPSCSSNSLMERLDMKPNQNGYRRMYSESSANSTKILKITDKQIQKDKIPKPENKASDKHPYFPTLANYSIPKLTATRKNEFSDTNELYLDRMHTLFGSDNSENESADECSSRTSKTKGVAKNKTVSCKKKLSKSSIDKHKSDQKRKVEWKELKPSKRHTTELKKIDKRRYSLETTRSPKMQQSESKAPNQTKLIDKHFTRKNEDRKSPNIQESELKASNQIKLMDKHSTLKNEDRISSKLPESELKASDEAKLVEKHSTGKNEDRRSSKIPEPELKVSVQAKLADKHPTGQSEDRILSKIQESELKAKNQAKLMDKDPNQTKLVDKHSTGKNEDRRSIKIQESELKAPNQAKLVDKNFMGKSEERISLKTQESDSKVPSQTKLMDKHSTRKNEDRRSCKIPEPDLKASDQAKLVDKHSMGKSEERISLKMQESDSKVPSQTKLMDKHFTGKNEDRRSSKIPEPDLKAELKAPNQAKLVDKTSTGKSEEKISLKIQESDSKVPSQTKLMDKHSTGKNEDRKSSKIPEPDLKASDQAKLVDKHSTGQSEDRKSSKIHESELKATNQAKLMDTDPNQTKLVDKHSTGKNEDRRSIKIQESELKAPNQARLVDKNPTGKSEEKISLKIQESDSKAPSQTKLMDKHSTGNNEVGRSAKLLESEWKASDQDKLLDNYSTGKNEDIKSPKSPESELKASDQAKLVDKHTMSKNEDRRSIKIHESEFKAPNQAKLLDKQSTSKNEDRRSIKIPESELKASNQTKLVNKHSTGQREDRRSPMIQESVLKAPNQAKLVDKLFTGNNEDVRLAKVPEPELKASDQDKLANKHSTGQSEDKRSSKIQESELKATSQAKLIDKHCTGKNEDRRSPNMPESEMKASDQDKLVDKHSTGQDKILSKIQESELKASNQAMIVDKHCTGKNEDSSSPNIPEPESKASDQVELLDKHSTGKNEDSCRKNYQIINCPEKMVNKRYHNPDPTSNKRRRTSAEPSDLYPCNKEITVKMTDIKKNKTKIVSKVGNTKDRDIKQTNKSKSDKSAKSEKNKTDNTTSDSVEATISKECKATRTEDVEPRSQADNKKEQSSKFESSNSSTITHTKKDLTSLLKNGIMSFDTVSFFHCSPLSPFQFPLRQTISQCTIVLNDCCDEAVTLERPEIKEIVQIIVNKSIKHITHEVIEIIPNIPVIDLTNDGDSKEARLSGISEPELSVSSKDPSPTIETKQELLDILKEQSDKSASSSEQITLYRSDETLNNSLEIQATSASISAAAVASTGMVHRDVASDVKKGKHLKVEDDSGVDMNESEEEGNKISSTVTNSTSSNGQATCTSVSPRPATAASEDNGNIDSRSNVSNTNTVALHANTTESPALTTNSVKFPVNTSLSISNPTNSRNPYFPSTDSSVLSSNLTKTSRLPADTFLPPPNKSVLDIPPSSQNPNGAIPIVQLPVLQAIGGMFQQLPDIPNGSGVPDASRNNIWRNRERSPPPAYPGSMPRHVRMSYNNPVEQSTTNSSSELQAQYNTVDQSPRRSENCSDNAQRNIPPIHNSVEAYKRDFNNLGALLVEYLLFFKNVRNAQTIYMHNIKKICVRSPLLLSNELRRFQDYYRDNMTELRTSLRMAVEKLHISNCMKINDVPNFLNAIEICLFQESSLTSRTSVVLWLHSLMVGSEDYYFWHGPLCCLYRYLETAVEKLRCRNQSGVPFNTDPFSLQQRTILKNQIEQYNTICAKSLLSIRVQEKTANLSIDLTANESHQVSGTARKSQTNSTHNTFQKIRLPLSIPYDVHVSTTSTSTSTLTARTSVASSKTTSTTGLASASNATELNSQSRQLNHAAGVANSPAHPRTSSYLSRITNIAMSPRTDRSPTHTSSSPNYSIRLAQEKLATSLNFSTNRNAAATLNFPTHTLSVACSPAHQPAQSNSSVYNSPAQSASVQSSPARIMSTLKSPTHVTAVLNSPAHRPAALNTNCSDDPHVFKPPQVQLRFRCPSNRVQQTSSVSMSPSSVPMSPSSVSMSPSRYSEQSSTVTHPNVYGVQASPARSLQDLLASTSASTNLAHKSTVETECLTLRNLLESGRSNSVSANNDSAVPSTTNDIGEKSPVYAPMLFSPSNYQVEEVDNGDEIETIDLTWVNDVDADHLQMEIDYFIKKEEPSEENHVILNQEQFPVMEWSYKIPNNIFIHTNLHILGRSLPEYIR